VREPGGVRQKALVIAYGVHESGRREVLGLDVGEAESESFWRDFLHGLVVRGLDGVLVCVSDAHQGLGSAIGKVLGVPWQRCTVHFLGDMLGHVQKTTATDGRRRDPPGLRRGQPRGRTLDPARRRHPP
jgi:putative transposase